MAKPKLGSGKRFAQMEQKVAKEPGVRNPAALAAFIGRQAHGAKTMGILSAKGKKG